MGWTRRNFAATVLSIGVLAIGCGGKVLEPEPGFDSGAGGGGAGGATVGGGGTGGYGHGGYGPGGYGQGGYGQGGYGQGGYGQGGQAGSGGAAGSAPACQNPDDMAAVQATYDAGTIEDVAIGCAMGCLADMNKIKDCVSSCVQESTGGKMSKACANCFGGTIACIASYCLGSCAGDPTGQGCIDCRCGHNPSNVSCDGEFASCSGIPDSMCGAP